MARTLEDIIANGPHVDECRDMTIPEALVVAYNCVEDCIMHGVPKRRQALAVIRTMLLQLNQDNKTNDN